MQPKDAVFELRKIIDNYCVFVHDDGFRSHLGASIIGHKCERYLWYTFRWCSHKIHSGRMYRLFNRGHLEENRIIEWLKGAGCTVVSADSDGKQFNFSACNGHFGGSCDGIVMLPDSFGMPAMLLECKTFGDRAAFKNLFEHGVEATEPKHFAQMSIYGQKMNLTHALYFAVKKSDDDIYMEIVELDNEISSKMEEKAQRVIDSENPPPQLSVSGTYFECKYCDYFDLCFEDKRCDKNCRSCTHAEPVENAEWNCKQYNNVIPKDFLIEGCADWKSIL